MNFCDAHTVPKKVGYLLGHNRTMIVMNTRNLLQKLLMVPVLLVVFSSSAYGFYDASVGRWINRDPIQEQGGKNLYRFASNRPLQKIDRYGLAPMSGGIGGPQFIPPGGFPRPPKKCHDRMVSRNSYGKRLAPRIVGQIAMLAVKLLFGIHYQFGDLSRM